MLFSPDCIKRGVLKIPSCYKHIDRSTRIKCEICGINICEECSVAVGKINKRIKCRRCYAAAKTSTSGGLIFISSIITIIGVALLSAAIVFAEFLLLWILLFIFLPVGVSLFLYSIYIILKYRTDAKEKHEKYIRPQHRHRESDKDIRDY